ncbi:platelet glycoprotein Ib alpha chain-like [Homarus americanus]|uniref:platelet glycoprotein Ib alpha chain-like n=1 Tax=Homarus americanus TaxID=6706 RepID=UPI001C46413E|nr:platelet glycoprotein Ib alpha chain-like [Homarus americanus]
MTIKEEFYIEHHQAGEKVVYRTSPLPTSPRHATRTPDASITPTHPNASITPTHPRRLTTPNASITPTRTPDDSTTPNASIPTRTSDTSITPHAPPTPQHAHIPQTPPPCPTHPRRLHRHTHPRHLHHAHPDASTTPTRTSDAFTTSIYPPTLP